MPYVLNISETVRPCRTGAAVPQRSYGRIALVAAIACLLLMGIWFRVEQLGRVPGFNGDEAWSGVQAIRFLQGESIAWRTPTGNPLNGFFWGPLVLLHAVLPPSIAALRGVSVASGVLAIGLNYWLCRRTFNQTTAIISTILLTVLPITIAYSRFAWDASQTPLASVLVIYACLAANRPILKGCLALAAAIVVHPTNLFLLPIAVATVGGACSSNRVRQAFQPDPCQAKSLTYQFLERIRTDRRIAFVSVVVATAAVFLVREPSEMEAFLGNLLRLFSGSTVYEFISGGVRASGVTLADLATLAAFFAASVGMASRIRQAGDPRDARLVWGTLAALVAFFVVAGPRGVQPHLERYAMWCIVPVVLIVARGAAWGWERTDSYRKSVQFAMLGYAAILLAGFQIHYFDVFSRTGGDSHLAFRTGSVDPKQAVLSQIQTTAGAAADVTIVSQSWWTRLPMQYLSAGNPRVHVVETLPRDIPAAQAWFVELAGSDEQWNLTHTLEKTPAGHVRSVCNDHAGRAVVVFYAPQESVRNSLKNFGPTRFDNEAN